MPKYFENEPDAATELKANNDNEIDLEKVGNPIALRDRSPMPFGKRFKGTAMEEVPVEYLHWIWTETVGNSGNLGLVVDYIQRNLHALKQENEDLIWGKRK